MKEKNTPAKFRLWLMAIRPKTLPAAVGPVAVGCAVAASDGKFAFVPALCCLLGAMLLQIGVNLANDYFDFKNNIDSEERLGPVRVTQSGLISPAEVKRGMIFCLFLAVLIFLYLAQAGGWPIVIIGTVSVLAALAYSGGPFPLASNGLGELFVFIFFGLVAVGGTYFIQAGRVSLLAMLASVPPGLLVTAIIVVNNLRDIDTDRKAGKNTLAVFLGRRRTIIEFKLLLLLSYLFLPVIMSLGLADALVLLPLVTGPQAWQLAKRITEEQGAQLNELLAGTARLSLIYSLLFGAGLMVRIS
ncbi:1,4-dihydroxy-2-naphthoate polyprenyltransferase [Desulfopila sp. IMCC35006]|uniref:1,4-dihydroxy-2-naphthoate polyprenyltransferase n=1 Tax=Desulfopila sp. IMCC35006 TaxID=2569542 RepID=UPI00197AC5F8|nr:1,4-dihydroxy-2-naphthoate polyprenyltransferase [Desulfopila sp. IMCC35006]